ncbi:ribonuclease H-like domain-containing protein [Aspergillus carlsbadensis]|nr:ribonuclease H-like domain-containing protein [Aspergillus carlsbadensis]
MVYKMELYVDGGCRHNGYSDAIGAAAIGFKTPRGGFQDCATEALPTNPTPTNQRAELSAIILALKKALEKRRELYNNPELEVTIYSDSRYAVGCMMEWADRWQQNEWHNSRGEKVANRRLIKEALGLESELMENGNLRYLYIPRERNRYADRLCNECLDEQEQQSNNDWSDSDW